METNHNLISELTSVPVLIGAWTFYPDILQLECGDEKIKLEPRAAFLLFYLAKNAGIPVSRDSLMEKVWPEMVVGDEAITGAINKLRKAFGDDSHHPTVIETIPKIGYRLIAEVEFQSSEGGIDKLGATTSFFESKFNRWRYIAVSGVIILLLVLMSQEFWFPFFQHNNELSEPANYSSESKPSIAVLPFANLSSDKEQDYFVDGLTQDLITDISKISGLFVIARNSVFIYRDDSADILQVAKELGVRYILEGSVRRAGGQIRINVQLTDTATGKHLWADRYDRQLESIFAIQDDITASIVQALEIRLNTQEKEAMIANASINFDAYDLFLRGQRSFSSRNRESISESISTYREVIKLDPDFSRAYGAIAVAMVLKFIRGWTESPVETLNQALETAHKAVATNNRVPQVYWSLAYVHLFRKEYDKAVETIKRAIEISPNYADAYALLALINNHQGNPEEAMVNISRGMDLNPYYTFDYPYILGSAQYLAGKYQDAIGTLNKSLEKNQNGINPRIYLIASYVRQGLIDDADWEVSQMQVESPEITISHLKRTSPLIGNLMDELALDLRKAGLPE